MLQRRFALVATGCLSAVLGLVAARRLTNAPAYAQMTASLEPAPVPVSPTASAPAPSVVSSEVVLVPSDPSESPARPMRFGCYEQKPQGFLVRSTYIPVGRYAIAHNRAVRYRAAEYGGLGDLTPAGASTRAAADELRLTTFMGLGVKMHRRVVPALRCVERQIQATCGATYKPEILSGSRNKNTFRGGEITNHMFGIAIDVDPHLNSCCNCVGKWRENPRCEKAKAPIEERMVMPLCWVEAFERFGFYWLGHDELQDTMHFEFLGDPAAIELGA
jgi:hypothetical protein